jgi:membrane protein DedA with SNARE-associated domain
MAKPSRDVPPPLEGNDQLITAAGTVAWAVALIVLVIMRNHIPDSSHWWIWTCAVGVGLGVFALAYIPRMKRSRARAPAGRSTGAASS